MRTQKFVTVTAAAIMFGTLALTGCSQAGTDDAASTPVSATASPTAEAVAPEETDAAIAPSEPIISTDAYRAGTWSDIDASAIPIPADVIEAFGKERSATAVDFTLDALTDMYSASEVYGPGKRTQTDFASMAPYLAPAGFTLLIDRVTAAEAGDKDASAKVNSLIPAAILNEDLTTTQAPTGEVILNARPGEVGYQLNGASVERVLRDDAWVLRVDLVLDITYHGTNVMGAEDTATDYRVQQIILVRSEEDPTSWKILDWGHYPQTGK